MIIAARFCAGLFGTQLLCATWLLLVYGVDLSVITPIGMAGSFFTLFCIVGTGRAGTGVHDAPQRNGQPFARTLWSWSTTLPPRILAKPAATYSEKLDLGGSN